MIKTATLNNWDKSLKQRKPFTTRLDGYADLEIEVMFLKIGQGKKVESTNDMGNIG